MLMRPTKTASNHKGGRAQIAPLQYRVRQEA